MSTKGDDVYLSDEDFRRANDVATQTIAILGFVKAVEVPLAGLRHARSPSLALPHLSGCPGGGRSSRRQQGAYHLDMTLAPIAFPGGRVLVRNNPYHQGVHHRREQQPDVPGRLGPA